MLSGFLSFAGVRVDVVVIMTTAVLAVPPTGMPGESLSLSHRAVQCCT